jgi:chromosome segregation ATPase
MSLILRQIIGYQQGRRATAIASADPVLKNQLEQKEKDLNSILKKWNWGGHHPKSAQEFLAKFEPWINQKIKEQKDLKEFLTSKGVNNLTEAETQLTNRDLSENEELENLRRELTEKQQELTNQEQTFLNTEQDYLRQIRELRERRETSDLSEEDQEKLRNYEDLETDLDQARRDKTTLEQEVMALNNQLRNKTQELNNKEETLARLKAEHSEKIKTADKKTKEWKEKYSKKAQQLDQEQVESAKLEEKITNLEAKITELEQQNSKLIAELAEKE